MNPAISTTKNGIRSVRMMVRLPKVWLLFDRPSVMELMSVSSTVELRTISGITLHADVLQIVFEGVASDLTDQKLC